MTKQCEKYIGKLNVSPEHMCVHKGVFPCQIQVNNYSKVLQDKKNTKKQNNKTAMRNTKTQKKKKTNLRILFKFFVQNDKSDPRE